MVHAGKPPQDPQAIQQALHLAGIYDLSVGRFDVVASVGPTYESRRQEGADAMIELTRANPESFQIMGDLMLEAFDWPGAKEIASRMRRNLPPHLQDNPDGQQPSVDQLKQQLMMLQKQLKELSEVHQKAQMMLQTEAQKLAAQAQMKQMELQAQERMVLIKEQSDLAQTQARLKSEQALTILQARFDQLQAILEAKLAPPAAPKESTHG
jgi:hypothetical protein